MLKFLRKKRGERKSKEKGRARKRMTRKGQESERKEEIKELNFSRS